MPGGVAAHAVGDSDSAPANAASSCSCRTRLVSDEAAAARVDSAVISARSFRIPGPPRQPRTASSFRLADARLAVGREANPQNVRSPRLPSRRDRKASDTGITNDERGTGTGRQRIVSTNVTLHAGHDVAYFTRGQGRGGCAGAMSYYTAAGEPPGEWAGKGAATLGLSGAGGPGRHRAPVPGEHRARRGAPGQAPPVQGGRRAREPPRWRRTWPRTRTPARPSWPRSARPSAARTRTRCRTST